MSQQTFLKRVYLPAAILIVAFLVIARLLWVGTQPYYDWWETISGLYQPNDLAANPVGAYFFWAAMVTLGLIFFPTILYVHPRLSQYRMRLTRLGSFWMAIGGIGFLLVGFVPQGTLDFLLPSVGSGGILHYIVEKFHEVCTGMGVIGVLFGQIVYWIAIRNGKVPVNHKLDVLNICIWWGAFILGAISAGGAYLVFQTDWTGQIPLNISLFFTFGVWERIFYGLIVSYFGIIGLMIPDRLDLSKMP
ncbi:MAG TPA: hypothetical protein VKK79_23920 [Candidatus Lokiarchaeia archaeon]|nr:hypothetical protein [Candidatus Lokiarchaeia archaeon]